MVSEEKKEHAERLKRGELKPSILNTNYLQLIEAYKPPPPPPKPRKKHRKHQHRKVDKRTKYLYTRGREQSNKTKGKREFYENLRRKKMTLRFLYFALTHKKNTD